MKLETISTENKWPSLSLRLSGKEVDKLIERLTALKDGKIEHFHISETEFKSDSGIADIEVSIKGENEADNTEIL